MAKVYRQVLVLCALLCAAASGLSVAQAADAFPGTTLTGSSGSFTGTTIGMTGQGGEPNFTGGATTSDWYSWTATATGYFTIGACNLTAETITATDTTLAAYTGAAVNALTAVQTNDDSNACNSTVNANYGSTLGFNVTSGTTYRFQLDTYQNSAQNTAIIRWGLAALTVSVTDSSATEGGDTASFTVVPTSPPPGTTAGTNSIIVTIGTSTQCTFAPLTLTFTKANWTTPQTVTVTAINDIVAEGTHSCSPASITTTNYGGVTGTAPTLTVYDNDNPSFTIAKSASVANISAPGTITYTITVDNNGSAVLTSTVITDALTLNGSPISLTTGPTLSSGDTNSNSILEDTETWVYTATYAVTQANIDGVGNFSNTATFDTAETSSQTSNAAVTTVTRSPSFTVVKSQFSGPSPITAAGQVIGYRATITNTGNQTLTGPTVVSDTFQLGGSARTLTSAMAYLSGDTDSDGAIDLTEVWLYSASYTVPQSDMDGTGNFTNLLNFDTTQTAPSTSNTVTTNVTRSPSIEVIKSYMITTDTGSIGQADTGDIITYYYDVTNTGNQTLSNVNVSDSHSGTGTPPSPAPANLATLAPTITFQFSATYTVTQADFDNQ